jgi:NAD(P)H-dependent FMN reductase
LRGEEGCPLKDDRDVLIEKMIASDAVIFATPNYSFQVSGIMKVFLDRLGFVFHRPNFHGRTFTSIVAQGIYGGDKVVKYLDFVGGALGFNVANGSCVTSLEPMTENARRKMAEALAKHAKRFHKQLSKPALPTPSVFQLMAFRMARTSMKQTLGDDNRDYTYYRDHGWFESDYYYPAKLGPIKRAAGSTFDLLAARMYKPQAG